MKKIVICLIFIFSALSFSDEIDKITEIELGSYRYQENLKKESKYILLQAEKISTLDPIQIKDNYSVRVVKYLYETLFMYDENGKLSSKLLKKWHWENERTLVLELKEGLKFSNGDKLTPKDVQSSLYRLKDKGVFKELFLDIVDIEILSQNSLRIKIRGKNKIFISMLTYYMSAIVKEKDGLILGTGVYKVKRESNRNILLEKNRYSKEYPKYNEVEIKYEISQRKRAISCYEEDANEVYDLSAENVGKWEKEGIIDKNIKVIPSSEMCTIAVSFGNIDSIFNKKENRKVLEYILEKNNYFKDKNIVSFFPKELLKVKLSKLDIEKNKINFFNNKIELITLNNEDFIEKAKRIKELLTKYGVDVDIVIHNLESYQLKIKNKKYQMAIIEINYDETQAIYNITKTVINDIQDKEMYNGLLPFINIMKIEESEEYRNQIYDKMIYLIYRNIPYIPLEHKRKLVLKRS